MNSKRKTMEQMLADDIDRCEEYLSNSSDEETGKRLYIDLTSRYDSVITGLGKGLYGYSIKKHFYNLEINDEERNCNIQMLLGKMTSYQAILYSTQERDTENKMTKKPGNKRKLRVFIVHGHDNEAKQEVARVFERSGFETIILHEQPNAGKTIIEKIEQYSEVDYAIVLYTECDKGRDKDKLVEQERYRARQNVVFEHGYLISKLGRDHVSALVRGDVETPGDISGVVYIPMDDNGAWKMQVAVDMQDVNLPVDMNRFCR